MIERFVTEEFDNNEYKSGNNFKILNRAEYLLSF